MIRTENLTRIFRTEEIETIALNGVNINVKDGEFVAIMGPSGCGKSTLLNILGLLDTPTEGKYWLGDEEVGKPSIILADEPTGNLDSKNGVEVMQLLSELNDEGTTIVMVTHSQHDATYAHRIINLFDGQVVEEVNDML